METASQPLAVTVAITRKADPSRNSEMLAWVRAGTTLAEDFPGFLGVGWMRPVLGSTEWHMLYRFADADALHAWEESPQRRWWLSSAQGMVEHTRVERRTGIEGWFDPPREHSVSDLTPAAPPRWKQAVTIWLGFFPVSLLATVTLGHLIAGQNAVVRTLVTTLCLTPLMAYLVLPQVTKMLQWWLQGQPPPWRR
ncbi:antibiotic biosynthesis monooxygenase [Amorphoplanes digitatis]|uniref:Antibiotic biosynthesis monooxygenase (ABM) superfamily enzyme n=1 Tax=Actinoplanes digitatis TaxID=1868 RepID=A0A7W7HTT8_9ACTN|nr:antibiotic biosynthesis monooxygenase [Actinoplanes digitatis]MBB4760645.1 antibiotic biosynthesis monooxygenase (ABM) superfamily enzyme [Actinoplanes digitatis]BFE68826.1 antibiotic biosynthesis monooxygenase [Actinoplanes digitatis]GID94333.1 antibiotic biosynthesis monooxygenase [Actinoplanes digitatis]